MFATAMSLPLYTDTIRWGLTSHAKATSDHVGHSSVSIREKLVASPVNGHFPPFT